MKIVLILLCLFEFFLHKVINTNLIRKLNCKFAGEKKRLFADKVFATSPNVTIIVDSPVHKNKDKLQPASPNFSASGNKQQDPDDFNYTLTPKVLSLKTPEDRRRGIRSIREERVLNREEEEEREKAREGGPPAAHVRRQTRPDDYLDYKPYLGLFNDSKLVPGLPKTNFTIPFPPFSTKIKTWSSEISYYLGGETFPEEGRFFPLKDCNDTFQYHILPSKFFVPPLVVVLATNKLSYKVGVYWRELRLYECETVEERRCDFISLEKVVPDGTQLPFILRTTHLLDYSYVSIISESKQVLVGVGHEKISPSLVIATGAERSEVDRVKLSLLKVSSKNEEPDYFEEFLQNYADIDTDSGADDDGPSSKSFFDIQYVKSPPNRHPLVEDVMVVERCQTEGERELPFWGNFSLPIPP